MHTPERLRMKPLLREFSRFISFLFVVFFFVTNEDFVNAHEVLCRRCGATITKSANALASDSTPPSNGKDIPIVLEDDTASDAMKKVSRLSNRVGQTFDVALFRTAQVKTVPTTRSIQDSFFPGYAWRVAECPVCGAFLGWSFDRPAHCHSDPHDMPDTSSGSQPALPVRAVANEANVDVGAILNQVFATSCLTKTSSWWHVEYCYKKHVVQYHMDAQMKRNPEWSLGKFSHERDTGESSAVESKVKRQVEQEFINGQRCDETNSPRSSTVSLTCCAQYHLGASLHQAPFIASVREPVLCKYEIVICVPELCAIPGFAPKPKEPATSTTSTSPTNDDAVCASGNPPKGSPRWFYGFDWSALIEESSSDMTWTRTVRPMVGTGSLM